MNVSQTIRAWALACVSKLLIVQGISANPPVTLQTETQTVSNLGSNTHLRSRRAPRVCALLTLCCSRAVRGCVCQGWSDWGEGARPAPAVSPRHQVSSSHVSICTVSLTLLSELALCCVSQTLDKWLLLCLCSRFLHLQDRGAAPGSGSALALQARVHSCSGGDAQTQAGMELTAPQETASAPQARSEMNRPGRISVQAPPLRKQSTIQPFLLLESLEEQFLNNFSRHLLLGCADSGNCSDGSIIWNGPWSTNKHLQLLKTKS